VNLAEKVGMTVTRACPRRFAGARAMVMVVGFAILFLNNIRSLHASTVGGIDVPSAALGASLRQLTPNNLAGIAVPDEVALVRSVYVRTG
jgi:hypothetical protein